MIYKQNIWLLRQLHYIFSEEFFYQDTDRYIWKNKSFDLYIDISIARNEAPTKAGYEF